MHHPGEALNIGGLFSFLADFGETCSGAMEKRILKMNLVSWEVGAWSCGGSRLNLC